MTNHVGMSDCMEIIPRRFSAYIPAENHGEMYLLRAALEPLVRRPGFPICPLMRRF